MRPGDPILFGHLALPGERTGTVRRVFHCSGTAELDVDFLANDHLLNPLGRVVHHVPALAGRPQADLALTHSGFWMYCYPR